MIIGGRSALNVTITSVEEISLENLKITVRANSIYESARPSLALLGEDKYIVKIGGVVDDNSSLQAIERYDIRRGVWENVDPSIEDSIKEAFHIFFGLACIQLSDNSIMAFGGVSEHNESSTLTFILQFDDHDSTIKPHTPLPRNFPDNYVNVATII